MMLVIAPACTNPCCCVNFEWKGNRTSTCPRPTETISASSRDMKGCRPKLSRTFFSNASKHPPDLGLARFACHRSLPLLLGQEAHAIHPRFAREVNDLRHVGKIHIIVASHKGD